MAARWPLSPGGSGPSGGCAGALAVVENLSQLYQETYHDLNAGHFQEKLRAEHGLELSYMRFGARETLLPSAEAPSVRLSSILAHRIGFHLDARIGEIVRDINEKPRGRRFTTPVRGFGTLADGP